MIGSKRLWGAGILALAIGCQQSAPFCELPSFVPGGAECIDDANPVYIPLGPKEYGRVFETVIAILGDYRFEIVETNRYDGRIECKPRTSPGIGRFLMPGSPDLYDRVLATTQSYRHRVSVVIHPAEQTGYFVHFKALKELEDVPRPIGSRIGAASFRSEFSVERQSDVVDPIVLERNWIPKGRDIPLEQELIRRLKKLL